jgi:hypothetical protein
MLSLYKVKEMEKIKPQQIRHAKIADLAANGMGASAIADHLGIGVCQVERVIASDFAQTRMSEALQNMDAQINARLPRLLELSMDALERTLGSNCFVSRQEELKAVSIVTNIALRLSELSSKNTSQKNHVTS